MRGLRLQVAAHSAYLGQYAELWQRSCAALAELGVELEGTERSIFGSGHFTDSGSGVHLPTPDLAALRWIADYPDADGFVGSFLGLKARSYPELAACAELEGLCAQGRHESDPARRHAIYRRIEETIARERLLLPLFHEQTYRFQQPQTRGLRLGLIVPEVRYEELYLAE